MAIDTRYRSTEPEVMDDFAMEGAILTDALDKIAAINKLLGGNRVTMEGIALLMKNQNLNQEIHIIDVGCGNGAMLRLLADYAKQNGLVFKLQGIDANQATITHARNLSKNYPTISYQCSDIFETPLQECDILLFTLTLHHFQDQELVRLLKKLKPQVRLGIVVNDLERSRLAYRLFIGLSSIFRLNNMSREDGLVSILRGFKKADLLNYEKELNLSQSYIKWRWAFRYLWVIQTS